MYRILSYNAVQKGPTFRHQTAPIFPVTLHGPTPVSQLAAVPWPAEFLSPKCRTEVDWESVDEHFPSISIAFLNCEILLDDHASKELQERQEFFCKTIAT